MRAAFVAGIIGFASPVAALAQSPALPGLWQDISMTDPITDARRGIAVVEGTGGSFVVKCDTPGAGSVYVSLVSDRYLGGADRSRDLTYRVDDNAPVTQSWRYSAQHVTNFRPNALLAEMLGGERMIVRALKFDNSSTDFAFDITGSIEAIARVSAICDDPEAAIVRTK